MRKELELVDRVDRDQLAAQTVREQAELRRFERRSSDEPFDGRHGATDARRERQAWHAARDANIESLAERPFHAMMEVVTETLGSNGEPVEKSELWYASEASAITESFGSGASRIMVLAWSHPGVQLALSGGLNEFHEISASRLKLQGVEAKARAKFSAVCPDVAGLYEPGGQVRPAAQATRAIGLKAVKLAMTADQVKAFISRMSGLMMVTGAPGSGKTTVALQRIRFLIDQQGEREDERRAVAFTEDRTRVFLCNDNLISSARTMLTEHLGLSDRIVRPVGPFIADLLDRFWAVRNGARLRQRSLLPLEQEARRAYFGLCGADMLGVLWQVYERQIADRLAAVTDALWTDGTFGDEALTWSGKLALALRSCSGSSRINRNPSASRFRLDDVYDAIGRPYEALRRALQPPARDAFDDTFLRVIFDIYDPLSALASAFDPLRGEGRIRIARGTGHRAAEAEVMDDMAADWARRQYGPEEQPWLAWLLRHALPEHEDDQGQGRIRLMPGALDLAGGRRERWTHVALDEAQDLSVVEASLLPSFVHPDGAVTVSADFRQAVTATKGMEDGGALAVGCPLRDGRAITPFRFGRNMRQTREIGRFLQGFYLSAFGESAPFDVDDERTGPRPRLILAPSAEQARRIRQVLNSLRQGGSVATVAVLQVNEDERTLLSLRGDLERAGLQLAPIFDADARAGIVTTSVERIKGLEFDACIVLGLEGAENAALNFTLNRAYVGLSRATQRLAMVCEHMPALLRRVDRALYDLPS